MENDEYAEIRPIVEFAIKSSPATIILGSGASAAFGMPNMDELKRELKEIVPPDSNLHECLNNEDNLEKSLDLFERRFSDKEPDLIPDIIRVTWELISGFDKEIYQDILTNNLVLPLTQLLEPCLRATSRTPPTIITTNYDKLAEYAVDQLNTMKFRRAAYYTGFSFGSIGYFDKDISNKPLRVGSIRNIDSSAIDPIINIPVWKVHGSINWFTQDTRKPICLQSQNLPIEGFTPEIITPGIEKYRRATTEPYRSIIAEADRAIDKANSFFVVGFGFRDQHIQEKLVNSLHEKNIPTVVLAKQLTHETKDIFLKDAVSNCVLIEQYNNGSKAYIQSKQGTKTAEYDSNIWNFEDFVKVFY